MKFTSIEGGDFMMGYKPKNTDYNGSSEPEIIKKNKIRMSDEIEKKILSLFSLGSSNSQITNHIQEIYGVHFSKSTITAVTDKLIPLLQEWNKRLLESIYSFIYLDAINYKVRDEEHYVSKVFYTVVGVNSEGKKRYWDSTSMRVNVPNSACRYSQIYRTEV